MTHKHDFFAFLEQPRQDPDVYPLKVRRSEFREIYKTLPAQTNAGLRRVLSETAASLSLSTLSMPSGAGHDAQEMAQLAPMAMIFVPSRGGISHSPQEFSEPAHIANGANVLLNAILAIDAMR